MQYGGAIACYLELSEAMLIAGNEDVEDSAFSVLSDGMDALQRRVAAALVSSMLGDISLASSGSLRLDAISSG